MQSIEQMVNELSCFYQKVYGHPEYDGSGSTPCENREIIFKKIISDLQKKTGKIDLKVLDIGCAQGYFCFALNEIGCKTTGVDFLQENVDFCNAINEENGSPSKFLQGELSLEFANQIKENEYDVVLCLNVLHHVALHHDFKYAREVLEIIASKVKIIIIEMAIKEEPVYWCKNLPIKYEEWFQNIKFFNEIVFTSTALSNVERPTIVCSNSLLYSNNEFSKIIRLDGFNSSYYCEDKFVKVYRKKCKEKLINSEIDSKFVLNTNREVLDKCTTFYISDFDGYRMWDLSEDGANLEKRICAILEILITLEKENKYYNNLRVWDIGIKENEVLLLRGDKVSHSKKDTLVYENINDDDLYSIDVYDTFLAFVHDVFNKGDKLNDKLISNIYDEEDVNDLIVNFIDSVLLYDRNELNFNIILDEFIKHVVNKEKKDFSNTDLDIIEKMREKYSYNEKSTLSTIENNIEKYKRDSEIQCILDAIIFKLKKIFKEITHEIKPIK